MNIEEDSRFRYLEKKIGIFAVVAALGFLVVVIFIGVDKDMFTQKYLLKFTADRGTGFSRGMPVKLSGFRIGRISSISLNEQAKVDIEIQIEKKYQKWIKNDSVAKLVKEGMIGDSIIEVSVGKAGSDALNDGAFIKFENTRGLEEIANDIAERVKPVLIEVKEIINYVNDPGGDIKQSMKNIREITTDLHGTREKIDELMVESKQKVGRISSDAEVLMRDAGVRIKAIDPVLEKADRSVAVVEQKLPKLLEKAAATMENLEKTSSNLEKITGKALPKTPVLLNSAEDALHRANKAIDAVMDIWPLKSSAPAPNEIDFVPGDSHE
jgi:phospholipid/cholesterol/gamma-HCH transport system substrate-binding protein